MTVNRLFCVFVFKTLAPVIGSGYTDMQTGQEMYRSK